MKRLMVLSVLAAIAGASGCGGDIVSDVARTGMQLQAEHVAAVPRCIDAKSDAGIDVPPPGLRVLSVLTCDAGSLAGSTDQPGIHIGGGGGGGEEE